MLNNPFFSMLGLDPMGQNLGQNMPQGGTGAGRFLGGGFNPFQNGSFLGGLAPWDYQVPHPVYQPSFLAPPPAAPTAPLMGLLDNRRRVGDKGPGDRGAGGRGQVGRDAASRGSRSGQAGPHK